MANVARTQELAREASIDGVENKLGPEVVLLSRISFGRRCLADLASGSSPQRGPCIGTDNAIDGQWVLGLPVLTAVSVFVPYKPSTDKVAAFLLFNIVRACGRGKGVYGRLLDRSLKGDGGRANFVETVKKR
jgi:hypothetical protein